MDAEQTLKNANWAVVGRLLLGLAMFMAAFFWSAGTFDYWQAWVYLAVTFGSLLVVWLYFAARSPDLLLRRIRSREKETPQMLIVGLSAVYYIVVFAMPGFDRRFGWSEVPAWLAWIANALVLLSWGMVFLVFKENRYTSRTVEVDEGQTVISSGPYALVRHPMYVGVILLFIATPIALGSYWTLIPALLIIPILAVRIVNEEAVLQRDLKGYTEYMQNTRYRLLPGVW